MGRARFAARVLRVVMERKEGERCHEADGLVEDRG